MPSNEVLLSTMMQQPKCRRKRVVASQSQPVFPQFIENLHDAGAASRWLNIELFPSSGVACGNNPGLIQSGDSSDRETAIRENERGACGELTMQVVDFDLQVAHGNMTGPSSG